MRDWYYNATASNTYVTWTTTSTGSWQSYTDIWEEPKLTEEEERRQKILARIRANHGKVHKIVVV